MIEPLGRSGMAYIFEFKVMDADDCEKTLEDTLANALAQIEEKQYRAELIAKGFEREHIRKYGVALLKNRAALPKKNPTYYLKVIS